MDNFSTVWYNPQLLTNIVSSVEVYKRLQATMDMATEKAIVVHQVNGTKMKSVESNSGLFYYETNNNSKNKFFVTEYNLVKAVE